MERLSKIYDEIEANLNEGYKISDLNESDRAGLNGFAWAIYNVENAFENLDCRMDTESTIGKMQNEFADDFAESVLTHLICDACDLVYALLDGYPLEEEGD